jgi:nucleoside-diphosphate-sugar epimerase
MIMVTGGNGFIGRELLLRFSAYHGAVVGALRACQEPSLTLASIEYRTVTVVDSTTNWSQALNGISCVVHCAAIAHGKSGDVREVNVAGTLNLAHQAAEAGVARFVFLSSIGVNGNVNTRPFTVEDEPNPSDSYAQSKWEAEQGLWDIQRETGIEIVIIRPPLVYGPGAPGNFGSLVRWVEKGIPLPLGAIHNKRSLVALDNLVDLIATCIDHPAAANQVFLAGDGEYISTTELLRGVARAMGKPSRLIPVPTGLLMMVAAMLGKKAVAQRLLGSLQVDISKAQNLLSWQPPLTVEQGLKRCFESRSNS